MNNMREMFGSFKSGIESTLHDLQVSVIKIKSQNTDITNSVQYMSEKHDEFLKIIEKLEKEKSENKKYIRIFEDRIENVERRSVLKYVIYRKSNMRIKKYCDSTIHI